MSSGVVVLLTTDAVPGLFQVSTNATFKFRLLKDEKPGVALKSCWMDILQLKLDERAGATSRRSALRAACTVEGRDICFRLKTEQGMYCGVWTMDVALRADSGLING